jgi:AcrR family transcriptional regulator
VPVEKLTPERRRQRTRDVLIDAASEVFARRGYEGASLEEIAETAGFTRGAIYKHFGNKEELFLAVNDRFNERIIDAFRAVAPDRPDSREWDVETLAEMWRAASIAVDERLFVLGMEFQLYVLRNPEAHQRSVAHRKKNAELVAGFIDEVAARAGVKLRLPSMTLARVVLAASDGLAYATYMDGEDLFAPFLEVLNAGMLAD